jgi:hypothetical protein
MCRSPYPKTAEGAIMIETSSTTRSANALELFSLIRWAKQMEPERGVVHLDGEEALRHTETPRPACGVGAAAVQPRLRLHRARGGGDGPLKISGPPRAYDMDTAVSRLSQDGLSFAHGLLDRVWQAAGLEKCRAPFDE